MSWAKTCAGSVARLRIGRTVLEQGDALRGLRKEIDRTYEVDLVEVFLCFDDQRGSFDLPAVSPITSASRLPSIDLPSDLPHLFVCFDDAPWVWPTGQVASSQLDAQLFRQPVGRRRFSMRPDEETPLSPGI